MAVSAIRAGYWRRLRAAARRLPDAVRRACAASPRRRDPMLVFAPNRLAVVVATKPAQARQVFHAISNHNRSIVTGRPTTTMTEHRYEPHLLPGLEPQAPRHAGGIGTGTPAWCGHEQPAARAGAHQPRRAGHGADV